MATVKFSGNHQNSARKTQVVSTHVATKTEKICTFSQTVHTSKVTINRASTTSANKSRGSAHGARGPAPKSAARGPTPASGTITAKGSAQPPRPQATALRATTSNFLSASSHMRFTMRMGHSIATTSHTQAVAVSTKVGSRNVAARSGNPSAGSSKGRGAGSSQSSKKKP